MDKDVLYDSVIEMAGDIRYMREDISDLKRELKQNADSYDERISHIEEIQNLNTGKLAVILVLIGAGVLGIFQFILMLWDKIPK